MHNGSDLTVRVLRGQHAICNWTVKKSAIGRLKMLQLDGRNLRNWTVGGCEQAKRDARWAQMLTPGGYAYQRDDGVLVLPITCLTA